MRSAPSKHHELHNKLNVDHAASTVLQIKLRCSIGVAFQHFPAHLEHFGFKRFDCSRHTQNLRTLLLKTSAELRISGHKACSGKCLMFPQPSPIAVHISLVPRKHLERTHGEPIFTIRTKPQINVKEFP